MSDLSRSIAWAVLILGAALATDGDFAFRATMALTGAYLVSTGNALPKRLRPLADLGGDPARAQAHQRLAGWTMVLSGLAFTLAWLALPVKMAALATFPLIGIPMLLLVSRRPRCSRG